VDARVLILRYKTGEEIKKDDQVVFHGSPGRIELVASTLDDPEQDWYVREYGGGVMICNNVFGRVFIAANAANEFEELAFVARASEPADS
jgi:uridine phosphorylase